MQPQRLFVFVAIFLAIRLIAAGDDRDAKPTPESKAITYLAREVPAWSPANKCYSCHNNGDAARALYVAHRLSYAVPPEALADTTRWLTQPDRWDKNGGDGPFSDKQLARLHFAAALAEAMEAGLVKDRQPLRQAAERLAADQQPDGSWRIDAAATLGSPVTYGTCLLTVQACHVLRRADADRFRSALTNAEAWLEQVEVQTVLDAAAVILGPDKAASADARRQRAHGLGLIIKGESKGGGWGPYVNSPPEPFDTAVVLLALVQQEANPELIKMIQRGRSFLVGSQKDDGSWPETTRPAGAESYAQRLSTTGWATQALLATSPRKP